jgi:hypothetical protein
MMMHVAAAAAVVTILGGSATPLLLKHCIRKLKSRKQQIKPNRIESDPIISNISRHLSERIKCTARSSLPSACASALCTTSASNPMFQMAASSCSSNVNFGIKSKKKRVLV